MALTITILPPGHPAGNPLRWFWEITDTRSAVGSIDCGKCDSGEDAFDAAAAAYDKARPPFRYIPEGGAPTSTQKMSQDRGVSANGWA